VDRDDFQAWLVLKGLEVASELLKWWNMHEEVDELDDVEGFAKYRGDTVADFYQAVRANVHERGWLTDGEFTVLSLARWCKVTIEGFGGGDFLTVEDLADYMRLEFVMVGEQHARVKSTGSMEDETQGQDVDTERRALAEEIAGVTTGRVNFGWHGISMSHRACARSVASRRAIHWSFRWGSAGCMMICDMRTGVRAHACGHSICFVCGVVGVCTGCAVTVSYGPS